MSNCPKEVKLMMREGQNRLVQEQGTYIPAPRRSFTFRAEHTGETVTVHGPSLGHNAIVEYEGPHGHWQAYLSLRGPGKPWAA